MFLIFKHKCVNRMHESHAHIDSHRHHHHPGYHRNHFHRAEDIETNTLRSSIPSSEKRARVTQSQTSARHVSFSVDEKQSSRSSSGISHSQNGLPSDPRMDRIQLNAPRRTERTSTVVAPRFFRYSRQPSEREKVTRKTTFSGSRHSR